VGSLITLHLAAPPARLTWKFTHTCSVFLHAGRGFGLAAAHLCGSELEAVLLLLLLRVCSAETYVVSCLGSA